jgi:hypothetical protein
MTSQEAQEFHDCACYALMLAEQSELQEVRDDLLCMVRAWLAGAKYAEHAASDNLIAEHATR